MVCRVTDLELLTLAKMGQLHFISIRLGVMLIIGLIVATFDYHHGGQSLHRIDINLGGLGGHYFFLKGMSGGGEEVVCEQFSREEKKVDGEEPRSISMAIVVDCSLLSS